MKEEKDEEHKQQCPHLTTLHRKNIRQTEIKKRGGDCDVEKLKRVSQVDAQTYMATKKITAVTYFSRF